MSRKQGDAMRERWRDPAWREKVLKARGQEPEEPKRLYPKCRMQGKCFAKIDGRCNLLVETPEKSCSFMKEHRYERR